MEQWAELRREHFVGGKSIKELARSTGLSRNTIGRALRSETPPSYRSPKASLLDPFKPEIHRLLKKDAEILALKGDSYRLKDRDLACATPPNEPRAAVAPPRP